MTEERRATDVYRRAEQELTALASAIQRQEPLAITGLSAVAKEIEDSLSRNDQLVVQALAGPGGSTLITNLVNVSILATKVGSGLGYYGEELERLTMAGLVHDIGLFAVPPSVVTKSGRLTHEERTLIEQHPELGYQLIRKLGPDWDWLAQVVRQAHERWNGRGYPNRLKGRDIHEMAQIIGAVDVFDALVTPRPYRRRFFPHEAVRELLVAERSAFPREIMKALVEQLSAYPLGTLVRLTTGEVGAVVGINTQFPLRPVVAIETDAPQKNGQDKREIDLSLSPLVSIIETVESPDVARVSFSSGLSTERRSKHVPTVSDQFAALLENLDALASAIQGVVESRNATVQDGGGGGVGSEDSTPGRDTAQEAADVSFEKEVIGLFALEAHEWLAQIHSALKRLSEGADGTLKPKLYGIMLQGLTNLSRSAATVHLTSIEEMALKLLPTLHDVGRQDPRAMNAALATLRSGLQRITAAVHSAEGRPPAEDFPKTLDVPDLPAGKKDAPTVSMPMTSGASLLSALRDLQRVRSRSEQPARDVLDAVILRAEQEGADISVDGVRRILDELDRMDERFVESVRQRIPALGRIFADLRSARTTDFVTSSQLAPIIEQVEALHEASEAVQAGKITMFLQGLRAFLMVAAFRKSTTLVQRLAAVENRLQALLPMAEQWVSIGRVERAAIADILPVG
ncbi:MAG TPA: HD domain-containing phosphohydrolase [Nitrospira sp.]|nr:HD domain-containing phosphohydrolase [Nitrospira sp.]